MYISLAPERADIKPRSVVLCNIIVICKSIWVYSGILQSQYFCKSI